VGEIEMMNSSEVMLTFVEWSDIALPIHANQYTKMTASLIVYFSELVPNLLSPTP
jgi:hypothetical protein